MFPPRMSRTRWTQLIVRENLCSYETLNHLGKLPFLGASAKCDEEASCLPCILPKQSNKLSFSFGLCFNCSSSKFWTLLLPPPSHEKHTNISLLVSEKTPLLAYFNNQHYQWIPTLDSSNLRTAGARGGRAQQLIWLAIHVSDGRCVEPNFLVRIAATTSKTWLAIFTRNSQH